MDKTELGHLVELLEDRFGSTHYEIVFAEKHAESGNWTLEVKKVEEKSSEEE